LLGDVVDEWRGPRWLRVGSERLTNRVACGFERLGCKSCVVRKARGLWRARAAPAAVRWINNRGV